MMKGFMAIHSLAQHAMKSKLYSETSETVDTNNFP